jgi:hypothetical protein
MEQRSNLARNSTRILLVNSHQVWRQAGSIIPGFRAANLMFAPRFPVFPTITANLLIVSVVAANEMAMKKLERVIHGPCVIEVDINRNLSAIDKRVLLGSKPK